MRISDWSSDVCSSDLPTAGPLAASDGWRNDCRVSCPMEPCSAFVLRRATPACLWQTRRITQQPGRIGQSPLVQSHHLRAPKPAQQMNVKIGRGSLRDSGRQYLEISVVAVTIKK